MSIAWTQRTTIVPLRIALVGAAAAFGGMLSVVLLDGTAPGTGFAMAALAVTAFISGAESGWSP